jgi:hypothetical protein
MISSTGSVIVPLAADVTTANVQDNQMYNPIISSSSISSETCFIIGDSGYDDHKLYDLSTKRGFELVCPVQRYEHTPADRLEQIQFYESIVLFSELLSLPHASLRDRCYIVSN